MRTGIRIPNATKKGFMLAYPGDGVDLERRKNRRGTVQRGMSQTIKTSDLLGVVVECEDRRQEVEGNP